MLQARATGAGMKALTAPGMTLTPLTAAYAQAMFPVLADPLLYEHLDEGPPESVEGLAQRYRRLEARRSPDGSEAWLNWVLCLSSGATIGFVQATVLPTREAWVAYLIGRAWWGQGHARAATSAMLDHLTGEHGCIAFRACVERANQRSIALLRALGFTPLAASDTAASRLSATEQLFVLPARAPCP